MVCLSGSGTINSKKKEVGIKQFRGGPDPDPKLFWVFGPPMVHKSFHPFI
jgi:hypothetical protein